jgi:hypothetical protein
MCERPTQLQACPFLCKLLFTGLDRHSMGCRWKGPHERGVGGSGAAQKSLQRDDVAPHVYARSVLLVLASRNKPSPRQAGQREHQAASRRQPPPRLVMLSKAFRLLPSSLAASSRLSRAVAARGFAAEGDKVWLGGRRGGGAPPACPLRCQTDC